MNPELVHRAEDIFYDLLSVDPAQREAAMRAACGDDEGLLAEVRSLLDAHREPDSFMDTARARGLASEAQAATLNPGQRIAGYTILGIMGMGGMGVVYVAQQDRPRRTVALKLIRRGLATDTIVRRFEHEAEVLGLLQHPGIAQIYEAGIADIAGQGPTPFIAMELIKGRPLCDDAISRSLETRARLDLIAKVCDAVEHAHQRGVIHRDLKPGNILVDEHGHPKVLDFGVARAVGGDLHAATMQTGVGQLVGTLQYMSPEQVRADPAHIDRRSDVFALGVVMFELLLGRPPHELSGCTLPDAARRICEDDPPRAGSIDRSLRGDVEIIIAKALEKEQPRRYQSAADLAADIRRHLDGRPISARDDSALYVLRRRLRRYHSTLAVAAASIIALSGVAAFALIQSNRNQKLARSETAAKTQALESLKAAKEARQTADATAARLRDELGVSNTERGRLFGKTGNLAAAEDLIWPAHLRNPESRNTLWALRELYSQQPCLATILAHEGIVQAMVLSADERSLYTCADDHTIKIWDTRSLTCTHTLRAHEGVVTCIALSTDNRLLASASLDGNIIIWDVASLAPILTLTQAHAGGVRAVAFNPDGTRIVSGGEDNTVRIWDARSGEPLATMPQQARNAISRLAWSPDGRWIVCGTNWPESRLRLWDGADSVRLLAGHGLGISSLAFSADGTLLATGGGDRQIHLWDTSTWKDLAHLVAPNGTVYSLRFTADGKRLMSTGWWTADIWDVPTRQRTRSFSLRAGALCGTWSGDGMLLATGAGDGTLKMWDLHPDSGLLRLHAHPFGRTFAALSPDARIVATGGIDGLIKLWERRTGRLLASFRAHDTRIRTVKFSPDGTLLVTGAEDYLLKLWDLRTGNQIGTLNRYLGITGDSCSFSSDGKLLAAIMTDWSVAVLHVPGMEEQRRLPPAAMEAVSVRFSTTSDDLAVVARDRAIHVWPAEGDTPFVLSSGGVAEWTTAFSPDGATLISGNWGKNVHLWDLRSRTRAHIFEGHSGLPQAIEYYPADPAVFASAGADGSVRLWDIPTGRGLITLEAFDGWEALSVGVSSNGRWLASAGANGLATVWELSYFDRFIAGNLEFQIAHHNADLGDSAQSEQARAWAHSVLTATLDDDAPIGPGIDPVIIAAWATEVENDKAPRP